MTGYAKKFNENITMLFRVNDKEFFKKYNTIWEYNIIQYWKANEYGFWKQTCLWW